MKAIPFPTPQYKDASPASGRATVIPFPGRKQVPPPPPAKRKRGETQEKDHRRSMLAKVHIAKKAFMEKLTGFDEVVYRDILAANFGVSSAKYLDNTQLHELLAHFVVLGWDARTGRREDAPATLEQDPSGMCRQGRMQKIEALLAEKGRVEGTDAPWGYAVSILKNQTAKDPDGQKKSFDDHRVTPGHLDAVIAALCKDAKRKGRRTR